MEHTSIIIHPKDDLAPIKIVGHMKLLVLDNGTIESDISISPILLLVAFMKLAEQHEMFKTILATAYQAILKDHIPTEAITPQILKDIMEQYHANAAKTIQDV